MTTGLLGTQIQAAFDSVTVAGPLVKTGKLRALGVSTATRSPYLPDVPTLAELGLPKYSARRLDRADRAGLSQSQAPSTTRKRSSRWTARRRAKAWRSRASRSSGIPPPRRRSSSRRSWSSMRRW